MNKNLTLLTVCAIGILGNGISQAASDPNVYTLNPIIVTATRTEKAMIDTPANTEVITGKEIHDKGYTNVFEAVRDMTQANAHTYQEDGMNYGGMVSRIRMRGIDNGTLVMVNGIPANFMNASALGNVPVDQVEKIEVVKGSASVLYGPQAMAGVINVITKMPSGESGKMEGNVYGSIGNRYKGAGVNVNTRFIDVGYKKYSIDDMNKVEHPYSNGSGPSLNLKDKKGDQFYADARLTDDLSAVYSRTNSQGKYEVGAFTNFKNKLKYSGKSDTTYNNFGLIYDQKETGWRSTFGYNTMLIKSTYDHSYPTFYDDSRYKGSSTNFDIQKKTLYREGKDSLVLGGTFNREHLRYTKISKTNRSRSWQNNDYKSYSLYESYDHQFTPKYSMIFGMREYWMDTSKYLDSDFQWLPQVQGLYKLNDNSSLYFNIGKSFEMPSVSQFFGYNSNYAVNSSLKPQSSWSYEAGYKYDDSIHSFSADIFHMDVKNKFFWDKTADGKDIMRNRDKWKNTGMELNYKQKITDHWDVMAGATLQNPKAKTDSKPWTRDAAKYILNMGTAYHTEKFYADINLFSYLGREWSYYTKKGVSTYSHPADHHLKDYWDLTASIQYSPDKLDTFKLTGYNLLNRKDQYNIYEYYTTPARFIFTYERKF